MYMQVLVHLPFSPLVSFSSQVIAHCNLFSAQLMNHPIHPVKVQTSPNT